MLIACDKLPLSVITSPKYQWQWIPITTKLVGFQSDECIGFLWYPIYRRKTTWGTFGHGSCAPRDIIRTRLGHGASKKSSAERPQNQLLISRVDSSAELGPIAGILQRFAELTLLGDLVRRLGFNCRDLLSFVCWVKFSTLRSVILSGAVEMTSVNTEITAMVVVGTPK